MNRNTQKSLRTFVLQTRRKKQSCLPGEGHEKNMVLFEQAATASPKGHYNFNDRLDEGIVSISEPAGTHVTAEFNKALGKSKSKLKRKAKKVKEERKMR